MKRRKKRKKKAVFKTKKQKNEKKSKFNGKMRGTNKNLRNIYTIRERMKRRDSKNEIAVSYKKLQTEVRKNLPLN